MIYLGTRNCENAKFLTMFERPPYRDIRQTLCGLNYVSRWDRFRDTSLYLTLHYWYLNFDAKVWLMILC